MNPGFTNGDGGGASGDDANAGGANDDGANGGGASDGDASVPVPA